MTAPLTNATEVNVPTDGADQDVWGLIVNAAFAAWDRHFGGELSISVAAGNVTLTAEQAQNGRIYLTGNTADRNTVYFPARNRTYLVTNVSTGNDGHFLRMDGFTNYVLVPPNCSITVRTSTLLDRPIAGGPPVALLGGFPAAIRHEGDAFAGPGLYFSGGTAGLANPGSGIIGFWLDAVAVGQASVRFNAENTAAVPLIGMDSDFDTGLYVPGENFLGFVTNGVDRLRIGTGLYAPGLTDPGQGKVNFDQYQRSGVAMPFQKIARRTALPLGSGEGSGGNHSQGSAPEMVFAKLRCISSDAGWATQDVVYGGVSFGNCNIAFGGNATQLYYRQNVNGLVVPNKSTGILTAADESKWQLELLGCWP